MKEKKNTEKRVLGCQTDEIFNRTLFYFNEISKIPRSSRNERAVSEYLVSFAKSFSLKSKRASGPEYNVLICKPGSKGRENDPPIILQAHIDMVCLKTDDSKHDFNKDPIKLIYDNNTLTADRTTLGADDGIGVACILALLESSDLVHPPIEALFTSDEEDGMTGAAAVSKDLLTGKMLINIDTEKEGTLYYGCAGGIDAHFSLPVKYEPLPENCHYIKISLSGLAGGHSGTEIHKNRANALKLLARTIHSLSSTYDLHLLSFQGGEKRNAIPNSAEAIIAVNKDDIAGIIMDVSNCQKAFEYEYKSIEKNIVLSAKGQIFEPSVTEGYSKETADKLIGFILIVPNDIQSMHGSIKGLPETSCNLGMVRKEGDTIHFSSLIRSFIRSKKLYVLEQMHQIAKFLNIGFTAGGDYPEWNPNPNSELTALFKKVYINTFSSEPQLKSIHAGLECGYFAEKFPDMDMIACGPTITGAHTTDETLCLDSVKRITDLLINVFASPELKHILK